MKVLIACEESQEVCKAFRAKGQKQDLSWHCKSNGRAMGVNKCKSNH